MSQLAFFLDGTRCTGCKTCVFACKDIKDLEAKHAYRHVYEYTGGETLKDAQGAIASTCFTYALSVACNHCSSPICAQVCPTGAMHKSESDGLVTVDAARCIGCGYCHMACPYNAPYVDRAKGHSVKCDACADLVRAGDKPACVMACPARALRFDTMEACSARGERANTAPLPDPSYTEPNLYLKPARDARPAASSEGRVANPLEVR
ncbi:MAG: 4Fe-4S binding protein [Coriobacteriales bacterium]|jgi:anaerobic dimethyl sulfoxide reductase subunit B (iron-sulfur subunit)|nr:4Fe-4S binding protein [Coriobacteriales bacterium]